MPSPLPTARPDSLARSHQAHSSIRVQTAKQKNKEKKQKRPDSDGSLSGVQLNDQVDSKGKGKEVGSVRSAAKSTTAMANGAYTNREITKVVLASPLTPRWPSINDSHQSIILNHLMTSFPGIAEYHISRDRCNRRRKKENRKVMRVVCDTEGDKDDMMNVDHASAEEKPTKTTKRIAIDIPEGSGRPEKRVKTSHDTTTHPSAVSDKAAAAAISQPTLLFNLVIGINEIMKAMEKQTAKLAARIRELQGSHHEEEKKGTRKTNLIPTAPTSVEVDAGDGKEDDMGEPMKEVINDNLPLPRTTVRSPLRTIFVCLDDINPPHLVHAIPLYVMSYNSLVRQWRGLYNEKMRNGEKKEEWMETLLVTLKLGSEIELAKALGLRRVAVFGMMTTFSSLSETISILEAANVKPVLPPFELRAPPPLLETTTTTTHETYAPTHLKAVLTTAPADPKSRKAARMVAVKEKREEKKAEKVKMKMRMKKEGVTIKGKLFGGTDSLKRQKKEKNMENKKKMERTRSNRKSKAGGAVKAEVKGDVLDLRAAAAGEPPRS